MINQLYKAFISSNWNVFHNQTTILLPDELHLYPILGTEIWKQYFRKEV